MSHPLKYAQYLLIACLAGCASAPTALEERRVSIDSYSLLAQIDLEQQRPEEATEHFLQAALISDDPAIAERTARMAHRLGLTALGHEAVDRWQTVAPDDERHYWFAGIFETRSRRLDRAIADFTALMEGLDPADAGSVLALLTEALGSEPDTTAGTAVMTAMTDRFPGTPEGHYGLARLAMRSGDFDLALTNAVAAIELEPQWLEAQLLHARTLLVAGRTQESLTLAARLADEHDDDLQVRLQYAELLLSAGRSDEARSILNDILADNPGLPEATRALAFLALTSDELDDAEQYFSDLRSTPNYRNEAFYYLGRIAETEEEYLQATRSYARVTEGTHAVEAQRRTAQIMLSEMDNADAALRHLQEFGNANRQFNSEMLLAQGQLLLEMRRPEDAMQLLDDALAEDSADASLRDAHVQLYEILVQDAVNRGRPDEAQTRLEEGLDRYPGNMALRYSQALLFEDKGRNRKAVRVLESLVEENPDNAALLNALGYLLADQFDRHSEARGYIQRALALDPDSAAIIDSMGWVLFKLGDYEAALDYLDRAWRLEQDPEIAAHLVDVYWALGEREQALELLTNTLEQHPDDGHLLDVSQRLDQ